MIGTLSVIGVGPGDPELLTLKALKILKNVKVICVPKGREDGSSLALAIIEKIINLSGKEIVEVHFPMRKTKVQTRGSEPQLDTKWQEATEVLLNRLNKGIDVAFITIGDPTIYSTFFYIYDQLIKLAPELKIVLIPGVSSINASAAAAKVSLSLADEKIAILPATYAENIKDILERFDTVVLMKVYKVFDKIIETLTEMNLIDNAVYISRVGADDEKIFNNIRDIEEKDLNYFSMIIVRR